MIYLRRIRSEDCGFTVVEMVITLMIFGFIAAILFQTVMNYANTSNTIRQGMDLNEEARLMLNRMSRELREAQTLIGVTNPAGSTYNSSSDSEVTFEVDFNADGTIEPNAADPERITYKFEFNNKRVLLQAGGQTLRILAGNVEALKLSYTSRRYECDVNGNGTVTWEELDSAVSPCPDSVGNSNGQLDNELTSIDSVAIDLTMRPAGKKQIYRTQASLRNRQT